MGQQGTITSGLKKAVEVLVTEVGGLKDHIQGMEGGAGGGSAGTVVFMAKWFWALPFWDKDDVLKGFVETQRFGPREMY